MVKLFVDNLDQLTTLEYLLFTHGIEHEIALNDGKLGLKSPYLLVYSVPLDEKRAIRWIFGQQEECDCE